MKVAVTGASGYIGRHIVNELINRNVDVIAVDKREGIQHERVTFCNVDLFESPTIFEEMHSPDVCIHCAWRDGFNHMSQLHIEDFPKHVQFIQTMCQSGLKQLVVLGTMHEVGYWEGAIDEHTPCNPKSYYGVAKNALRQVSEVLCQQNNTIFQWVRAYYILGDDTKSNSVFSKILQAAQDGKKEFPLNSGKNEYDFIQLDELAKQIVSVALQTKETGIINCCTGEPISLLNQIQMFIDQHQLDLKLNIGAFPDREYDSPRVWGNPDKINKIMKG